MKIRFFNHVRFEGDWELNFVGERLNVRIGRSQVGVWWDYKPLFSWLSVRAVG